MADARDDDVRARYRALATEEPPAAIDDAIRAAARRAVSSAPGAVRKRAAPRWAVPASIAAVLMLSFGVVMQMQTEAPKTELEMRAGSPPVFSQPPTAMAPIEQEVKPEELKRAAPADKARTPEPAKRVPQEKLAEKKDTRAPEPQAFRAERPALAKEVTIQSSPSVPAAAPPAPPPPQPVPQPKAFADAAPVTAPAAPAAAAAPAPARDAMAERNVAPARRDEAAGSLGFTARAKTESPVAQRAQAGSPMAAATAERSEPWPDTPEKKLERIEALRKAGRDREADEAIARFRREHPDYRIPEDAWNRIKPR